MSGDYLRRYTDLTGLIYLLRKRKLTLLDPSSWDAQYVNAPNVAEFGPQY